MDMHVDFNSSDLATMLENLATECTWQDYGQDYADNGGYVSCYEGHITKRVKTKTKAGKNSHEYVKELCPRCSGKGKVLTPAGEYLLNFLKEWYKCGHSNEK